MAFYITEIISYIQINDYEPVKNLIKLGHDINQKDSNGNSPLTIASTCDNYLENGYSMIKLLLKYGADVNITNFYGTTALMLSCTFDYSSCGDEAKLRLYNGIINQIKLLLSYDADPNIINGVGFTALMYATLEPSDEIIIDLLLIKKNYEIFGLECDCSKIRQTINKAKLEQLDIDPILL
jgi:ankyrin repeat protein